MPPDYGYTPDQDYSAAYNALKARTAAAYAGQRGTLNNDLAARGVETSGVSAIPMSSLLASEAETNAGGAQNFALEQARTGVREKEAATQFVYDTALGQQGFNNQSALSRRLGQNQLAGQLGAGGLSAIGSVFMKNKQPSPYDASALLGIN